MSGFLYINEGTVQQLQEQFKNKLSVELETNIHCPSGTWQTSRYIQIFIPEQNHDLHYEYRIISNSSKDWVGRVELHFESEQVYADLIDKLINLTQNDELLNWSGYRCQYVKDINSIDDLVKALSYMMDLFNPKINEVLSNQPPAEPISIEENDCLQNQIENVQIHTLKLEQVLQLPLYIPDYQRIYCWKEDNVKCLLDDVFEHLSTDIKPKAPYRMGAIILHHHENKYDIIDGQQRLITLSLLLLEMGVKSNLLDKELHSTLSLDYVAYNRFLIRKYIQHHSGDKERVEQLLESIDFTVLVLQNTSLDLAYTFFSNINSRGVALTNYDLLKAHHLRYIPPTSEKQSMLVADVWNQMIENGRVDDEMPDYVRTLDTYIYRLRKWMRKKECDDSLDRYRIKREYEAAPIVDEIPPFGEKFYFNEPIQGGAHFFSYVEQHLNKYHNFNQTKAYLTLHGRMNWGSHLWYRDVIESLLFGYYLKFGDSYLCDALVVIMRIILQHRYDNKQARKASIVKYAGETELILIIDQATSPTFFLAEARNIAKELSYPYRQDMVPVMSSMRNIAASISSSLNKDIVVESFKNLNR